MKWTRINGNMGYLILNKETSFSLTSKLLLAPIRFTKEVNLEDRIQISKLRVER
jgi:hypothetical protein